MQSLPNAQSGTRQAVLIYALLLVAPHSVAAIPSDGGHGVPPHRTPFAAEAAPIRVVLSDSSSLQQAGGDLAWHSDGRSIGATSGVATVERVGSQVKVAIGGRSHRGMRLAAVPRSGYVRFGGRHYRGRLEFFAAQASGVVVLNLLPLEEYLLGVVPAEMPAAWPTDALRAQAIASRTYALSRMSLHLGGTYDVYATTADQVYRGVGGEDVRASRAVRETAGQILTHRGYPIIAYYCADAGGYTLSGSQPYLRSVPSPAPDSPYSEWTVSLDGARLSELARSAGCHIGVVKQVEVGQDSVSGHLQSLVLAGDGGKCSISGSKLRKLLGYSVMRSTRVRVELPDGAVIASVSEPAPKRQAALTTVRMEGYRRPWVAYRGGAGALKMRNLYAYNGQEIIRCNRGAHVYGGAGFQPANEDGGQDARPTNTAACPTGESGGAFAKVGEAGIVLRGSGYGHGLGMSQWGAKQLASEGFGHRAILKYFYSGIEIVSWNGIVPPAPPTPSTGPGSGFYAPYTPRKQ